MDQPDTHLFHSFSRLVLTVSESTMEGVWTDHAFELRARADGADVWRSSIMHADGGVFEGGERFVGSLSTRQVIDLLEEIERSGLYEALPALGLVGGAADPDARPVVSMQVVSDARSHQVLDRAPADAPLVHDVSQAVRRCVEAAMERALSSAG